MIATAITSRRGPKTPGITRQVFFKGVNDEVAWHVAGYLLAWRIASSPHVGSISYSPGQSDYRVEKGNETSVTVKFLEDQLGI